MRKAAAAILVSLMIPSSVFAQSQTIEPPANSQANRVATVVGPRDGLRVRGALQLTGATTPFSLAPTHAPSKARKSHPVMIGAAIGAGAGYLLNATACRTGESVCTVPGNILMAGIGAGVGAVVGLFVGRR
jgi:hypothetical protein